jgi:hypothetical protein
MHTRALPLLHSDLFVAYKQVQGSTHIPKGTLDLLFEMGNELGVHTAIKAIYGFESPYGVALICRILGIGNTSGIRPTPNHLERARGHLWKLGLLE